MESYLVKISSHWQNFRKRHLCEIENCTFMIQLFEMVWATIHVKSTAVVASTCLPMIAHVDMVPIIFHFRVSFSRWLRILHSTTQLQYGSDRIWVRDARLGIHYGPSNAHLHTYLDLDQAAGGPSCLTPVFHWVQGLGWLRLGQDRVRLSQPRERGHRDRGLQLLPSLMFKFHRTSISRLPLPPPAASSPAVDDAREQDLMPVSESCTPALDAKYISKLVQFFM